MLKLNDHPLKEVFEGICQATINIAAAEDLDRVLRQVVDSARRLIGAQYAAISVPDGEYPVNHCFVFSGTNAEDAISLPRLPQLTDLLGDVIEHKKAIRMPQVDNDSGSASFLSGAPAVDNFLGVPILDGERALGGLYLTNKVEGKQFTALDQQTLEMVAAQAAVAIKKAALLRKNAWRSQKLELRNRQLAVLNEAAAAIAAELSPDKVLQKIVDSARELANAEYAALGVPSAEGFLETFIYSGMPPEDAAHIPHLPRGLGLLGAIIEEKKPIRLPRIADDPRSVGFPEGHPPMESFLGVPVLAGEETLGNLYLTNKIDAVGFTEMDQELVEMLAVHAAIAIQNARLYEQVGRLAIIEERTRIGMDLHDGVIQSIYAVGLTLESTRLSLRDNKEEADHLLGVAIEGLNETIRDIRNFILDLRPHRFHGDLNEGLARLVREFQANTMVKVELEADPKVVSGLSTSAARTIFLTTQEALANVARHARASHVKIDVQREGVDVVLCVVDDGRGFDPDQQLQSVGHGLSNMRARAEELDGSFELQSAPGEGTTITLTLPYR